MDQVAYGSTGETVGRIGLECMGLSGYAGRDDVQSIRVIHRALERGVSLLDTSMSLMA
jgi:aryl-alcohol dehydrogenase-like predicted oxidoreductase